MSAYQERLLKDALQSAKSAIRMFERESARDTELMAQLPTIRTQLLQAAMWVSEAYGAITEARRVGP